jgi:methyl-accepting chemotaxis protein
MNSMDANEKKLSLMDRLRGVGQSGTEKLGRMVRFALTTFVLLAAVYAATTWLVSSRVEEERDLAKLALTFGDFEAHILEQRHSEKSFMKSGAKEDFDEHKDAYEHTKELLAEVRANPETTDDEMKLAADLEKHLDAYRKAFLMAADAHTARGINEESGLHGKLRKVAHGVEDLVSKTGSPELRAALLQLRRHEKDFILREREEYATAFAKSAEEMDRQLDMSRIDAGTRAQISKLMSTYVATFDELVAGTETVNKALETAGAAAEKAEEPLHKVVEEVEQRAALATAVASNTLMGSAALLVVVLLGLATLLYSTKRAADATFAERMAAQQKAEAENEALNNSVISILQAMQQLAQRDLTAKAPVTQDVIGTVSDSINMLTDETARVLHGVTRIADQVEQVSGKVKSQADLVSQTAEDERRSVQRMLESLEDATQTMTQVANLAEQSNTSAEQATQATVGALDTVNGTLKGMESIRETIAETEKRIKRLGERSQEITGIVNLINTISERTHVLALNASMQAAVAGEAGRGFAVVAEEVQRLAESSRNATQQIGALVNNIQLETNETINTVNRTISQVVQGSEQAQKAGEQMRRTQEITGQLVAIVRHIAQTSDRQKAMSVQLLESVEHIGRSTERTAEQIHAQNQETETLLASARQLVQSVNVFKLPQFA